MTRTLLFALGLALSTAAFSAHSARACGPYAVDPTSTAIRDAVLAHARQRAEEPVTAWVVDIDVEGRRARAVLRVVREDGSFQRPVRLVLRGERWRVRQVGPARRVAS